MSTPVSSPLPFPPVKRPAFPILWCSAGLSALLAAGAYVYYSMFTGFQPWDDDGYLLIGIRFMLEGHRLYDDVYAQYGPFYYLVHWIFYSLLRLPVTHDTERFLGVIFWLVSAILWARVVYVLTRSRVWAGLTFFLAVKLLAVFPWSAGHPEEICMVLVATAALLACHPTAIRTGRGVAALACAGAALVLTKINIGLYLGLALALILLEASPPTSLQRFTRFLVRSASLVLPVALMRPLLSFGWTQIYCFTATVSIAAVIFLGPGVAPRFLLTARSWCVAVLSFLSCTVLVTLPFFFHGTSPGAMLYMTVLQYANFAHNWYVRAPLGGWDLAATGVALAAFAIASVRRRATKMPAAAGSPRPAQSTRGRRDFAAWIGLFFLILKGTVGLSCILAVVEWNPVRSSVFPFACVSFVWLLLIDPVGDTDSDTRTGFFALCTIAVFVYLYAFPVAGAQTNFAILPTGVIGILLFRDCTLRMATLSPTSRPYRTAIRIAPAVASLLILALFGRELRAAHWSYKYTVSLGMPGAERIRVSPQVANLYAWMKLNLDSCPAFYSVPALFSLYFWTGKESPTTFTVSDFFGMATDEQQRNLTNDLSLYPDMCILYSPKMIEFWRRGQDLARSPLQQYVQTEFRPTAEYNGYYLMKKR